ncbi:eukaryotic translation initiation factor 2D isoform X2 [Tribolium castaneum]|uniref:Eukaryotic translation initiation factor 2D-like Protein n=2 Tax=Tribolium castaneum TaxID=7070 RepID=D7EIK7_TRICA|nr:PREDICTED: eukaryotic translation initiation factor 2D isoform X2 [Tribolium castaneum]EFA12044.2 Eukaryotic translation initiation factor 2D-like Protein [Tribolium castaneum]|eukprot:XP_008199838.1 PREDICTED: eukaryotic translation initiation factor 2D isoform X2 [Tribolium castaneum]
MVAVCVHIKKMFRKPIKVKSNTQMKGSDRKTIRERFLQTFPNLTEVDLELVIPKKETVSAIKIVTEGNEVVNVYSVQRCPFAFEIQGVIFPTVFTLWKLPLMLQAFTTHSDVVQFLYGGADLMLPGVVTPPGAKYGNLPRGAMAYVNVTEDIAAVAVGVTAQSSSEMLASGKRGKCLLIYHTYGDNLCSVEGPKYPRLPVLGPPEWMVFTERDFPALGAPQLEPSGDNSPEEIEEPGPPPGPEDMDQLLTYCFFVAIKYSKTLNLPILTSNFFKLQMMPVCPDGKTLDIKKSTYKKLKPFLDAMQKDGLITIKEAKKGVESITAINKEHPKFAEFYVDPSLRPRRQEDESYVPTSVTESYIITPAVAPLFEDSVLRKGDVVQMSAIRKQVCEYVKKNHCDNEENKKLVKPKEALVKICKTESCITWEELMEKVCEAMKSCYKVSNANTEFVNKGKVSPITLTVSQRSGNKKVTLVNNLELFGIQPTEFAKECQIGVGASTSVTRPLGRKGDEVLVQGNQVLFVHNLLTGKYKVPPKYIRGLEYAPKRK